MDDGEISLVRAALQKTRPRALVFTGGEPTLYTDIINGIADTGTKPAFFAVHLTTNGWFAKDNRTLEGVLAKIRKLDRITLSVSRFHGALLTPDRIHALSAWCGRHGASFGISACISAPEDLISAASLREKTGADVTYMRVEACGRAADRGIAFPYPAFEERVLERMCPNQGTLTYIAGRGFSVCCANLAFNGERPGFVHRSLEEHLESDFYREIESRTLGEMLAARATGTSGLLPRHSSACGLCEHLHADTPITPS